jgi:hypothetical protein
MSKLFAFVAILLVMLFACQAAPTPTTVPTAVPPPTLAPTNTPAATSVPTTVPLPQVSAETFYGTWTQFDPQLGSNNFLIFRPDGTYTGRHGASVEQSAFVFEGKLMLEKDIVTFFNDRDCPTGEKYRVSFMTQVNIRFDLIETQCDFLAEDMKILPRWQIVPGAP